MKYDMRETDQDIANKKRDLDEFTQRFGASWEPLYEPKYRLDACVIKDGKVVAFVEHKTSNTDGWVYLNLAKASAGVKWARDTGRQFILLARKGGELGFFTVFQINTATSWTNNLRKHGDNGIDLIWLTDNRPGHNNGDDSEPCYKIPWADFKVIS